VTEDLNACVVWKDVSKRFANRTALDRVTLALPEGRVSAIVGESGSGKSTLLHLTNGLVTPDSGKVIVLGESPAAAGILRLRRRTGFAVQGVGLFPNLTVFENVTLLARLEGWGGTRIAERFSELLALMELPGDMAPRYPHALSGGEAQRVGLCRAMMLDPPLLLLDEPFSAVDPITRSGIHERFEALRESTDASVLLVTHDMREAVRLGDWLVVMRQGRVLQSGPLEEVLSAPQGTYVARLVEEQLC
jgi:osmoprotectant transport system ATP-binding protein